MNDAEFSGRRRGQPVICSNLDGGENAGRSAEGAEVGGQKTEDSGRRAVNCWMLFFCDLCAFLRQMSFQWLEEIVPSAVAKAMADKRGGSSGK